MATSPDSYQGYSWEGCTLGSYAGLSHPHIDALIAALACSWVRDNEEQRTWGAWVEEAMVRLCRSACSALSKRKLCSIMLLALQELDGVIIVYRVNWGQPSFDLADIRNPGIIQAGLLMGTCTVQSFT
ncbi:hypothetical protein NDU88_008546 [Pleurodeles waltl]|uniref:Uncharacterized protein n=1 Tax=Pleurodeles waltl TaxID=8319 RepID=A0AAV7RTJ4_PLEWA|nr:hypothetical protein NDU88_008546 [Pleurodeles waltl]